MWITIHEAIRQCKYMQFINLSTSELIVGKGAEAVVVAEEAQGR